MWNEAAVIKQIPVSSCTINIMDGLGLSNKACHQCHIEDKGDTEAC